MKRLMMFLSLAVMICTTAMAQTQKAVKSKPKAQTTVVKSVTKKTAAKTTANGVQKPAQSQKVSTPDPNAPVVTNKNVVIKSRPVEDPAKSNTNK